MKNVPIKTPGDVLMIQIVRRITEIVGEEHFADDAPPVPPDVLYFSREFHDLLQARCCVCIRRAQTLDTNGVVTGTTWIIETLHGRKEAQS